MKYIFIENPIAGNKDKQLLFRQVQSAFRMNKDEMVIEETKYHGHAKEIAARYAAQYADGCVIVSCGGDGTVHEIANALAHTPTPLMILPFGTGNDFAKKIYKTKKINPYNVVKAFGLHDGNVKYKIKPIDLIDYNGEKCINIMSYGLDVKVETIGRKIAGKIKFLGQKAYNIAIIPAISKPMHYQINIDINCVDENGNEYKLQKAPLDYALLAICNASYYGGGFCPAPNSLLDDGLLDFAYVEPVSIAEALPLLPKYNDGAVSEETTKKAHTGYMTSGRVWSVDGGPLLGECDGENFNYSEVNFKVEKQALNLCFTGDYDE
ncbi:MAG: hypothetical protein LUH82_02945 [Clostridiales bacterium]|nr:hypothetical protein [Clostridiales bacterium]